MLNRITRQRRDAITCLLAATLFLSTAMADDEIVEFDIPAQPAAQGLNLYAEQAEIQILFPYAAVKDVETNAVVGDFGKDIALETLLAGTGLEFTYGDNNTATVRPINTTPEASEEARVLGKSLPTSSPVLMAQNQASAPQSQAILSSQTTNKNDDELQPMLEEVIVTGTRIRRAGYETLQPATTIDSDFIDARAATNIADLLNQIPTFGVPGAVPDDARQAQSNLGQNFVNIFGLGSQRTLVLLNGRRVVPGNAPADEGTSSGLQVDLNIMPTAIIDRVETIYIGGSPVYGNDAVAGTVNIITKDDYEGLAFDGQYGISQEGDGDEYRVRGTIGTNFADRRGNMVFSAEYHEMERLDSVERAEPFGWAMCQTRASIFGYDGTDTSDGLPGNALCSDGGNVWQAPDTGAPSPLNTFLGHPGAINPDGVPNEDSNGDGVPDRNNFLPPGSRAGAFINAMGNSNPGNFFVDENGDPFVFSLDGQDIVTFDQANLGNPYNVVFSQGAGNRNNPYVLYAGEGEQLQPEIKRLNIYSQNHLDVTAKTTIFSEFLYSRMQARDFISQPEWSSTLFGRSQALAIKLDNPFLPDRARQLIAGQLPDNDGDGVADANLDSDGDGTPDETGFYMHRSNFDMATAKGGKYHGQDTFRILGGVAGEVTFLNNAWTWDSSLYFGQTNAVLTQAILNQNRRSLALDAVADPATGDIVCRSTLEPPTDPRQGNIGGFAPSSDVTDCTPFNAFGINNHSPESLDYIYQERFQRSLIEQAVAEINAAGDLFELPGGPISAAVGFAYREESAEYRVDQGNAIDLPGRRAQEPTSSTGSFNINELYTELLIPVFDQDFAPVPLIERFWVEGAIRFIDNDAVGRDTAWTLGGRMNIRTPFFGENGLQLRGNFTQSVRAPSVLELFLPQSGGFGGMADPCDPRFTDSGPNPAIRRANCEAEVANGIADGTLDPDFVLADFQSRVTTARTPTLVGGNPGLNSEIADSWTIGLVISPESVPGFQASLDWISIDLSKAVTKVNGTQLGDACYDGPDFPNSEACSFITRDFDFQVTQMITPFRNAAQHVFEGAVGSVNWQFDAANLPLVNPPGSIAISGDLLFTDKAFLTVGGTDISTRTDSTGGIIGNEKYRWQLNFSYLVRDWDIRWQTRYTGKGYFTRAQGIADSVEGFLPNEFDALVSHSLMMKYQISEGLQARLVVDNLFDDPGDSTRQAAIGALGTNPAAIGRIFTVGFGGEF